MLTTVVVTSLATAPALSSGGNFQTTSKGLSGGAIGGIVAGAVVGAALLLAAGFWLSRKYQKSRYGGVEDAERKGSGPERNISVLSRTGLLAGQRRKNTPRYIETSLVFLPVLRLAMRLSMVILERASTNLVTEIQIAHRPLQRLQKGVQKQRVQVQSHSDGQAP